MSEPPLSPPEPSRYCPVCLENVDDAAPRETVGGWELVHCHTCGAEVNVEALPRAARCWPTRSADAADDEREERWFRDESGL